MEDFLSNYCQLHTQAEDEILQKISRNTHVKMLHPRMLSGHYQGVFLQFISQMLRPQNILEIGTFTAYATVCLAKGLQKDGQITSIEANEELEDIIREHLAWANLNQQVNLIIDDAAQAIPKLKTIFDLVWIDADKKNNALYFDMVIEKVRPGGFILSDNVLWNNQVLLPKNKQSADAKVISAYNQKLQQDKRIENLLLPIRDGILLSRKK